MRELLQQHDGKLYNCPFVGPLYNHAKAPREKLLQNNHKHGSRPEDLNKNKYASKNKGPPHATIAFRCPKVNSVQFDDHYDHINHMDHTHENTQLVDNQEQDMEKLGQTISILL